jgi:hypothetical protein
MVPAGPAVDGLAVLIAFAAGVGDEAFFGDVELAAEAPVVGVAVIVLGVLGWDGDWADKLSGIFEALKMPRFEPPLVLAETAFGKA